MKHDRNAFTCGYRDGVVNFERGGAEGSAPLPGAYADGWAQGFRDAESAATVSPARLVLRYAVGARWAELPLTQDFPLLVARRLMALYPVSFLVF